MSHSCQLCYNQSNRLGFFDADGKEVAADQNPVSSVCYSCLEVIGEYDCLANFQFMWNDLTEDQQKQILPYIYGTARHNMWMVVFDLEDFEGETFEDWLAAVAKEYDRWVPKGAGIQ